MKVKIVESNGGFYCETVYKGVSYAQNYKGLTYYEAEAKFKRYVMAWVTGNGYKVLNGTY